MALRSLLPACAALFVGLGTMPAHAEEREKLVVTTDMHGYLLRRFGVLVEYLASRNDGIVAMPFLIERSDEGTTGLFEGDPDYTQSAHTQAQGLDAEYRRYFTNTAGGGRGFYVALGFEVQHFSLDHQSICLPSTYEYNGLGTCPPQAPADHQSWTYVGPSFDLGGQWIARCGFVLTGSLGVHVRAVLGSLDDSQMPWGWSIADGPGLRPRVRFALGWAFR
jgi:hypothetical protein